MAKKTKPGHVYTDDQNKWIADNAKLQRAELTKQFNKKFGTRLTAMALAKRRQRLTKGGGSDAPRRAVTSGGGEGPRKQVTTREVFDLIQENTRLIHRLLDSL